jgi:hypothetical protein
VYVAAVLLNGILIGTYVGSTTHRLLFMDYLKGNNLTRNSIPRLRREGILPASGKITFFDLGDPPLGSGIEVSVRVHRRVTVATAAELKKKEGELGDARVNHRIKLTGRDRFASDERGVGKSNNTINILRPFAFMMTCGVNGCEFQTKRKGDIKRHQARVHGIGDVDVEEQRRKQREYQARQPVQRCGVDGCEFQTKDRRTFKEHQARVHGIGDVDVDELRRKKREYIARQPAQRCGVDGCEFQTKHKHDLKRHQARVHGIGNVDADARRPVQRCGIDGCEFQTKHKSHLKDHQALLHGIGDVDAEELRRRKREYRARQPVQRCGVDGCEFQTKT